VLVKGVPTVLRRATDLKNSGSEKVGGADTYKVTGKVAAGVVAPLVGVVAGGQLVPFTIWVGKKDYVLRRARLEGPVARSEPSDITRSVELSKFDEPVTIRPPAVSG
jgi:lipoprotein LprG